MLTTDDFHNFVPAHSHPKDVGAKFSRNNDVDR